MPTHRVEVLRVPRLLFAEIDTSILAALPNETGGILLGRCDGTVAVVTSIVGPGPSAEHDHTSFDPDQPWQVAEVARRYAERPYASEYLGDWHSHPYGRAEPSITDWWVAARIARYRAARNPKPLMMICSATDEGVRESGVFQFWRLRLRGVRIEVGA